jgi:hypothetical protein
MKLSNDIEQIFNAYSIEKSGYLEISQKEAYQQAKVRWRIATCRFDAGVSCCGPLETFVHETDSAA